MYTTRLASFALGGVLVALAAPACDLDVSDLNNPGLDELENNPNAVNLGAACTGLLIGNRGNTAAENGVVVQLGILGREGYNFDQADPRYIGELLQGDLNPGSPFGGNFWGGPYANLKLGSIILHGIDKAPDLSDADKAAMRGFTKTIGALDLLRVIVTHDENGAVIDTDRDLTQPLAPIVDKAAVYDKIVSLLDGALPDLDAAGDAFPFLLSDGYAGFDTPATFRTFNRAIRARVAVYLASEAAPAAKAAAYQMALDALAMSFIDEGMDGVDPDFDLGVYHSYSTKTGDTTSNLINPNLFAHPSLETDSKVGAMVDARFTRKVATAKKAGSAQGLTSDLTFGKLYPSPASPVALIRNEELILIKAEALFFTGDSIGAFKDLNLVRTKSGGLPPQPVTTDAATFVDQLLFERRFSLLFEGGHRWIDLRRFGKPLPLDKPDDVANIRYPIPLPECNARPGEPRCKLGST